MREECRVREQDFGNFQVEERMQAVKQTRQRFGRFFYRFPEGESAADVFDRVSSKLLPPSSSSVRAIGVSSSSAHWVDCSATSSPIYVSCLWQSWVFSSFLSETISALG